MTPKPPDYRARHQWQLDARARGEIPECGREACHEPADPAWVGSGTGVELLYCAGCAREINRWNPGVCVPEPQPHPAILGDTRASYPPAWADLTPKLNRAQRRARGDYTRADATAKRTP